MTNASEFDKDQPTSIVHLSLLFLLVGMFFQDPNDLLWTNQFLSQFKDSFIKLQNIVLYIKL